MKNLLYHAILILFSLVCFINTNAQKNPFIRSSLNAAIDFEHIKPEHITDFQAHIENQVNGFIRNYFTEPFPPLNERNVLYPLDSIYDLILNGPLYVLLLQVHPDEEIRTQCNIELNKLDSIAQAVFQNKTIYNRLVEYNKADASKQLSESHQKALIKYLKSFENNGIHLKGNKAEEYQKISSELFRTGMMFMMNAQMLKDTFYTTKEMLTGMSLGFLESHINENGQYFFVVPGPDYSEILEYADNEEIRKQAYFMRRNFAYDANKELFQRLLALRMEKAKLLGYDNYTNYQIKDNMIQNISELEKFLDDLTPVVKERLDDHYHELVKCNDNQEVYAWDISYLDRKKLNNDSDLNLDSVKKYFPAEKVITGLFEVTGSLFDIEYKEVNDFSAWHEDVRLFNIYKDQKIIGSLYLDIYSREGKSSQGAMCGPFISPLHRGNTKRLPQLVLVSSFANSEPSLLSTFEVLALFHEIGHGMHCLFQENEFIIQNALETELDFIEIPSTLFELWVWEKDVLKHITEHIDTHEPLPDDIMTDLLVKIKQDQLIRAAGLLRDALFDYNLHTYYNHWTEDDLIHMLREQWDMIYSFPYPQTKKNPLTHDFMFGIDQYAGNIYSYIWALVNAQDILSVFRSNGIINPNLGNNYREKILAPAATKPANELMIDFLGRELNQTAFFEAYTFK